MSGTMPEVVSAETVKVHIRQRIEAFSGGYYVEVTASRRMPGTPRVAPLAEVVAA